jgi:type I restriction enzyme S subunit
VLKPRPGLDFDYCLHTIRIRPDVGDLVSGSTRAKLNQEIAASIAVLVPPLSEQKQVAAILNEQMAAAEKTRKALEEQLVSINALPAALLRQAFSGKL